jgi:nucleotide-binding universal stress UspA family protein
MTDQPGLPRYVVGVDADAPDARQLVHRAAALARQTGARLDLVLAYEPTYPTPVAYGLEPVPRSRSRAVAHDQLDALVETLDDDDRALLDRKAVGLGPAGPTLVDRADDAELLVVGSRVRHGLVLGALTGSVADYCVRHARCSVLVVRAHHHAAHGRASAADVVVAH